MFSTGTGERLAAEGWAYLPKALDPVTVARVRESIECLQHVATEQLNGKDRRTGADREALIVVPEAENPRSVCRYEYVLGADRRLRDHLIPLLCGLLHAHTGRPFVPFKDKVNQKQPGGGAFRPHQDMAAYRAFPPRYHVTAMIGIDPADSSNGCLRVGRNYRSVVSDCGVVADWIGDRPLLEHHRGGPLNGDILGDISARLEWIDLPTGPADVILIDSFVPHCSERNVSESTRRALLVTFSPEDEGDWYEHYYAEKRRRPLAPEFHVSTPTRHSALDH